MAPRTPETDRQDRAARRLRGRRSLLIVAAAAVSFAGAASAAPVLDQQQPTANPDRHVVVGPQVPAQIVTSGMAGLLTEVQMAVECPDGASLIVEIHEALGGNPTTRVLASQTLTAIPYPADWRRVVFATPPFIPAETAFAIVLRHAGDSSCGVLDGGLLGNQYPRGDGRYQGPPNPPDTWSPAGSDLAFRTFVEQVCAVPDVGGQSEQDARAILTRYGCAAGAVTRTPSSAVPADVVVSQSEAAGTQLAAGAPVGFVVSAGQARCTVPKVMGATLARARAAIVAAHCRIGSLTSRRATGAKGRVVAQRPVPGVVRPGGARVDLVIGR